MLLILQVVKSVVWSDMIFRPYQIKKPSLSSFLYWTCIEWNHVLNRNVAFSICGGMKIGWNRSSVWRWKRLSTFPCQMIRFRDLWFTASGQPTRAGTTLTGCRSISRYPRWSTALEEGSSLTKLDVLHRKALSSIAHTVCQTQRSRIHYNKVFLVWM